jgi:hypothetical protein
MSAHVFEIPLIGQSETFSVVLLNITYQFSVTWRDAVSTWFLDIADASGNPLVQGIPLVTGADLLGQYEYLGIGGALIVMLDGDQTVEPTYVTLGQSAHLRFAVSA